MPQSKIKYTDIIFSGVRDEINGEFEIITKKNETISVWFKTKSLYDTENNLIGVVSYTHVITDIKKRYRMSVDTINEALNVVSENELKYQALFEDSVDAIFIMTEDIFVDCNKAVEKMFVGSKEEILKASLIDFLPYQHKDNDANVKMIKEYIVKTIKGKPQRFDMELCRMDKKRIHAEINMSSFGLNKQPFI